MIDEIKNKTVSPFACELGAIPADERPQHLTTARQLFQSVKSVREIADGYAFQLSDEPGMLVLVAQFINPERLCCPFFGFGLKVEAEAGGLWLRLIGREGVKDFIRAEIAEFLGEKLTFEELLVAENQPN